MPAEPRLSYLRPREEAPGRGFAASRGGGFVVFCRGSFVAFADRGFVAFAGGVFLGLLASLEFLAFLDFTLGNTSSQRSGGCSASPVPGCDAQGVGWGRVG